MMGRRRGQCGSGTEDPLLHRRDDRLGAGLAQAVLAAEMIGDAGAVDARRLRDLADRARLEAMPPEQIESCPDQRLARSCIAV